MKIHAPNLIASLLVLQKTEFVTAGFVEKMSQHPFLGESEPPGFDMLDSSFSVNFGLVSFLTLYQKNYCYISFRQILIINYIVA